MEIISNVYGEEEKRRDIELLMQEKAFQRLIIDEYITKRGLGIVRSFTAGSDEIEQLKAISDLCNFLEFDFNQDKDYNNA